MLGSQFTDGQSVDPKISDADPDKLVKFVEEQVRTSEVHRNKYAILTSSWLDDASKCAELYNGKLYSKRAKKPYECKADLYAYYVDFNSVLMKQFDYKMYVKTIDESGETVTNKDAMDELEMTRVIQYCNKRNKTEEKEEDMLRFLGIHGNGIYKFQPTEDEGELWPGHDVIDPRYMGFSPGASDVDDAVFVYYRRPVPTSQLKHKYKASAEKIKPDESVSIDFTKPGSSDGFATSANLGSNNWVTVASGMLKDVFGSDKEKGNQTILTEFYYRDPAVVTLHSEQEIEAWIISNPGFGSELIRPRLKKIYMDRLSEEGGQIEVLKYPHGRLLMVASKTILDDMPNPYPWFPFVNVKCFRRPKDNWAKGVIHKMREPIQNEQMLMAGSAANADYRMRPAYFTSGTSHQFKKVPTDPNSVMSLGPNTTLEPIPVPPVLPSDILNLVSRRRQDAEMTAGLEAVMSGQNQTGTYSGAQFGQQLEQASLKPASRFREITRGRQRIGEMQLWFIQNYITDERKIEFLSEEEGLIKVQLNTQNFAGGTLSVQHNVTSAKYHFYIDVGAGRPISKSERYAQVREFTKQMAPFAPLLAAKINMQAMDLPGKQEMLLEFKKEVGDKQMSEAQSNQQQIDLATQKFQFEKWKQEQDLEVKQTTAAAKVQDSMGRILYGLAKIPGVVIPPQILQDLLSDSSMTLKQLGEMEINSNAGLNNGPLDEKTRGAVQQQQPNGQ